MEKEKLHELEEQEFKNLQHTTTALREMKHDMEIHLNVMQSLAQSTSSEELLTYITNYHQTLVQTHHIISSGNTAIDCIVSSKIDIAQKHGIQTDFSILLPEEFPIDNVSLLKLRLTIPVKTFFKMPQTNRFSQLLSFS